MFHTEICQDGTVGELQPTLEPARLRIWISVWSQTSFSSIGNSSVDAVTEIRLCAQLVSPRFVLCWSSEIKVAAFSNGCVHSLAQQRQNVHHILYIQGSAKAAFCDRQHFPQKQQPFSNPVQHIAAVQEGMRRRTGAVREAVTTEIIKL